jgi:catechol 2,3-dioxygenase-like lactoylglutathione lyase family enzyme
MAEMGQEEPFRITPALERTAQFYTEVLGFTVKARDRIERSSLGLPIDLVYLI